MSFVRLSSSITVQVPDTTGQVQSDVSGIMTAIQPILAPIQAAAFIVLLGFAIFFIGRALRKKQHKEAAIEFGVTLVLFFIVLDLGQFINMILSIFGAIRRAAGADRHGVLPLVSRTVPAQDRDPHDRHGGREDRTWQVVSAYGGQLCDHGVLVGLPRLPHRMGAQSLDAADPPLLYGRAAWRSVLA